MKKSLLDLKNEIANTTTLRNGKLAALSSHYNCSEGKIRYWFSKRKSLNLKNVVVEQPKAAVVSSTTYQNMIPTVVIKSGDLEIKLNTRKFSINNNTIEW